MPETFILSVDISGYQLKPAADYYLSLAQEGVKVAYVQAWGGQPGGIVGPNKYAEQQLRGFRTAGMQTGIYFWLPAGKAPEAVAAAGLLTVGDELPHIDFTVVDIESSFPTPASLTYLVSRLDQLHKPVAIYCRANAWPYGSLFPSRPLIEARYVLDSGSAPRTPPSLDWRWASFGGWTQRAGLQYAGTVVKYGVGTDLNIISLERLGIKKGGEEDMPTQAEFDKLRGDVDNIIGQINQWLLPHLIPATAETVRTDPHLTLQQIADHIWIDPLGHVSITQAFVNAIAALLPAGAGVSEERVKEIVRELVAD